MITRFKLKGLTCEACVKLSAMRLKRITGVQDVKVNLKNGETEIIADHEVSAKEAELVLSGTQYSIVNQ